MTYRKNQIVYAESQDYGKCIIQLVSKLTKNVDGEILVGFFEDFDKRNFMEEICSSECKKTQ